MNNTGVTGQFQQPKTGIEHEHVWATYLRPRILAYIFLVWVSRRQTDLHIDILYISREVSIEQPHVGLASLAQLEIRA